jgi:cellobiose-specific phosphotransferase system component IIB
MVIEVININTSEKYTMSNQIPFVSRCVPKAKNSDKGTRQFDADLKSPQVRFMNRGGSKNFDQMATPMLKVRKIEVIDGKKYKVIS